jgi:hypothetical protein
MCQQWSNQSPNVVIAASLNPAFIKVPQHPIDVFFNAASWADDRANSPASLSVRPPFNTAAQIPDFTQFVNNMLMGNMVEITTNHTLPGGRGHSLINHNLPIFQ